MKAFKFFFAFAAAGAFFALPIFSQNRPVANSIEALSGKEKSVTITWEFPAKCDPPISGVQIFRGKKPFVSFEQIKGLEPIAKLESGKKSCTDTLAAPGDYFYAALAETPKGLYKIIIPGVNATTKGAKPMIPEPSETALTKVENKDTNLPDPQKEVFYEGQRVRSAPLPNPGTLLGFSEKKTEMSAKAKKAARELGGKKIVSPKEFKSPYFFEEDMFSPDGGDEYTLFEALRAGLAPKKYPESVDILKDYLSVRRSQECGDRAQFYLGESYYFCKDYKSAIGCFIKVQDAFPELSKQWIDSSLDLLTLD